MSIWGLPELSLLELGLLLLCAIPSFAPFLFLTFQHYTSVSLGTCTWFSRDLYLTATCSQNYTALEKEMAGILSQGDPLNFDFLKQKYFTSHW